MINFSTLQGLTISEGAVTKIADASGRVLWMLNTGGGPVILEVEKITSDTYAGGTAYTGEQFILLDIYPKTNGTVTVTYGGLTKTITDTSGAEEPNAQQVFFGTFNGVSDSVETPASGTLTIEGDCRSFASGSHVKTSKNITAYAGCVTEVVDFGEIVEVVDHMFDNCKNLITIKFPDGAETIGAALCTGCVILQSVIFPASVTQIRDNCLMGCSALTDFTILATTPPTIGVNLLDSNSTCTITVPKGCGDTYKAAEGWSQYSDYIVEAS